MEWKQLELWALTVSIGLGAKIEIICLRVDSSRLAIRQNLYCFCFMFRFADARVTSILLIKLIDAQINNYLIFVLQLKLMLQFQLFIFLLKCVP